MLKKPLFNKYGIYKYKRPLQINFICTQDSQKKQHDLPNDIELSKLRKQAQKKH